MTRFKSWLETKDYNPYPPDATEKQTKDGPHYPKDKNLIQHTDKTQLQVREAGYETGGFYPHKADPYLDLWKKLHPDNIEREFRGNQRAMNAAFDELERLAKERLTIGQYGPGYHD